MPVDYLSFFLALYDFLLIFSLSLLFKCYQIGLLLFSCANSFTLFILWFITGFHLNSHFFNCWFVSSNLFSSGLLYVFVSSSGYYHFSHWVQLSYFLWQGIIYWCLSVYASVCPHLLYDRNNSFVKCMEGFLLNFPLFGEISS